jgi:hypothetical protein
MMPQIRELITRNHNQFITEAQHMTQQLQHREREVHGLGEDITVLRDSITSMMKDNQIKDDTSRQTLHEMNQERDRVVGQLNTMMEQLKEIQTRTQDELKALRDKIDSPESAGLEEIQSQIHGIEGTVKDKTRELFDKIDDLQRTSQREIQGLLKTVDDSRQLSLAESEMLLKQVEDLKDTSQREMQDALERLQELERVKNSMEEHFTSESGSRPSRSAPIPYIKNESSQSQPESGVIQVVSAAQANEAARRTLEKKNMKRKRQSSQIMSDDILDNPSRSTSNPPTPVLEEPTSQTRYGRKKKNRHHRNSGKPAEYIEIE